MPSLFGSNTRFQTTPTTQTNSALLLETALQLFKVVEEKCSRTGNISDQYLLALRTIFQQQLLLQALELVEQHKVTSYVRHEDGEESCRSGSRTQSPREGSTARQVCVVKGSSDREYMCCWTHLLYCSCPSFVYSVKVRRDAIMCKHLLASCLALALQRCPLITVSSSRWEELCQSFNPTH